MFPKVGPSKSCKVRTVDGGNYLDMIVFGSNCPSCWSRQLMHLLIRHHDAQLLLSIGAPNKYSHLI